MKTIIKNKQAFSADDNLILLCDKKSNLSAFTLSKDELNYIQKEQKEDKEIITINQYNMTLFFSFEHLINHVISCSKSLPLFLMFKKSANFYHQHYV